MNSIRQRLQLGLILVIGFFILQIGIFYVSSATIENDITATVKKNTEVSHTLSELAVEVQKIRRYEKEYFIYVGNIEKRTGYIGDWTKAVQASEAALQTLQQNKVAYINATEVAKVVEWKQALDFYKAEMQKVFAQADVQNTAAAIALSNARAPLTAPAKPKKGEVPATEMAYVHQLLSAIDANAMITAGKDRLSGVLIKGVTEMEKEKLKETLALTGSIDKGFDKMSTLFLSVSLMGIALLVLLLIVMPPMIITPITRLSGSIDLLSKGNIDKEIAAGNVAEFKPLAEGLERLRLAQSLMAQRIG